MAELNAVRREKTPRRLPVECSPKEICQLPSPLDKKCLLAGNLLYGSGLRVLDCSCLRFQNTDLGMHPVGICTGKSNTHYVTILPEATIEPLEVYLEKVHSIHPGNLEQGLGRVYRSPAQAGKYPNASTG